MAATDSFSAEDQKFLAQCEEEFKHRFTEKDEEYMKVYSAPQSIPPIVEDWWVSHHRRRNAYHPYARHGNRDNYGRRDQNYRRYNDNRGYSGGYDRRNQRPY